MQENLIGYEPIHLLSIGFQAFLFFCSAPMQSFRWSIAEKHNAGRETIQPS